MNRRTFFNGLGAAIIGTVIALKVPSSISGIESIFSKPKITFNALMEAYLKCCKGNTSPNEIVLHPNTFEDAAREIRFYARYTYISKDIKTSGFKFMGAGLVPCTNETLKENEIGVFGDYPNNCGKFEFI